MLTLHSNSMLLKGRALFGDHDFVPYSSDTSCLEVVCICIMRVRHSLVSRDSFTIGCDLYTFPNRRLHPWTGLTF